MKQPENQKPTANSDIRQAHLSNVIVFVMEQCEVESTASIAAASLYEAYQTWCEEFGLRPLVVKRFWAELMAKWGVWLAADRDNRAVSQGIRLKTPDKGYGNLVAADFERADRVSSNFVRDEFACKCGCGFCAVDIELLFVLEDVRSHFGGRRLHITSGNRCVAHNADTPGGGDKSKHVFAIAADFWIEDVSPDTVADYLEAKYRDTYGIGRYDDRTHLDVRGRRARWDERTKKGEQGTDAI